MNKTSEINTGVNTFNRVSAMKRTLKAAAAILGMVAVGVIFWYIVIKFMWMCYYAGIPM